MYKTVLDHHQGSPSREYNHAWSSSDVSPNEQNNPRLHLMLDAFVVRLLRRRVGICHVGAPSSKCQSPCTKVHTFTSTQTLLRTSEDAHSSGPVPWPGPTRRRSSGIPCPCSSALVNGRHVAAITHHGRLQRHGNVDLGRETRSGSGLEVSVDAP